MLRKLTAAAALTLVAAACSDATGPENFDPIATQQTADALVGPFSENTALQSLSVLGTAINLPPAQLALAVAPPTPAELAGGTGGAARLHALQMSLLSLGSASPTAIFPSDILGNTYVYNVDTQQYEVDPTQTDAPATGVRFILYAVDPIIGQVLTPLQEIGTLDLTDESTVSADVVRLLAEVNGTTYLDYLASASRTSTGTATLGADGFVSNGVAQVDFNLTVTASASGATADYLLSANGHSLHLVATLGSGSSISATLTVSDGTNSVELAFTGTATTLEGTIKYNSTTVVLISGTPDAPVFTRSNGTALTQDEIVALQRLGAIFEEIFDHFDDLLGPALLVFAFG